MRWSTSVDLSRADAEEVGWRATQGRSSGVGWEEKSSGMLDKHTFNQRGRSSRYGMVDGEEGRCICDCDFSEVLNSGFLPRRFNKLCAGDNILWRGAARSLFESEL
jgi:hypothetical protein